MTRKIEPDPDLAALVRQLNTAARDQEAEKGATPAAAPTALPPRWPLPRPTSEGKEWIDRLLSKARKLGASDLLIVAGASPAARVNGGLRRLSEKPLSGEGSGALVSGLVPVQRRDEVQRAGGLDFSFSRGNNGRFRCNVHRERNHWSAAIRLFPSEVPELDKLNLPESLARFTELDYGLVLVTGPTGCGKSTTLAALVRRILARRKVHLITIEDPVEYEHPHGESIVEHIEIGRDVPDYPSALRAALRQDPDVLLIGEMRDPESISIAITAAETGHLVLSTLHTGDGPQTVHRILDSYPASQMEVVRVQLSISLAGIISQQLLPRKDGDGRVPAVEILMATRAVRNLVRLGKIQMLRSQISLERQAGMFGLDESLAELVREGLVDENEARVRARTPEEFRMLLRRGGFDPSSDS